MLRALFVLPRRLQYGALTVLILLQGFSGFLSVASVAPFLMCPPGEVEGPDDHGVAWP